MSMTFQGERRGGKTCSLSLLDHWNDIASVLVASHIGLACEKAYQAFLIIAETAKILNNHPDYDPHPEAEKLAAVALAHEAQMQREALKAKAETEFATMTDTPLDKNKVQ